MSKGIKVGVKNPIYTKTGRMYRYTLVVYRYTLAIASFCVGCTGTLWRVYRYTLATVPFCIRCTGTLWRCTGTHVPFFFFNHFFFFLFLFFSSFFYYIFLKIRNSGADVKMSLPTAFHPGFYCMLTFILLIFYPTDCIQGVGHCSSFFGYFQSFHGVYYFSSDQGP